MNFFKNQEFYSKEDAYNILRKIDEEIARRKKNNLKLNYEKLNLLIENGTVLKEEKENFTVYTCGNKGLCKIIVYPDGEIKWNIDCLEKELDNLEKEAIEYNLRKINDLDVPVISNDKMNFKYFSYNKIDFKYFSYNHIKDPILDGIDSFLHLKSDIKFILHARIYNKLLQMGYGMLLERGNFEVLKGKNELTENFILNNIFDCMFENSENNFFRYECKNRCLVKYDTYGSSSPIIDLFELTKIIEQLFDVNYGQVLNSNRVLDDIENMYLHFEAGIYDSCFEKFSNTDYAKEIRKILNQKDFKNMMINYEIQYSLDYYDTYLKHAFLSLRSLYNVFPESFKLSIACQFEFISTTGNDYNSSELLMDTINIFSQECSKKDGSKYTDKEILAFLCDVSRNLLLSYNVSIENIDFEHEINLAQNNNGKSR